MQHDWMIDVLTDLQSFAKQNEFRRLSEHLEDVIHIAAAEIAAKECVRTPREQNEPEDTGLHRSHRSC